MTGRAISLTALRAFAGASRRLCLPPPWPPDFAMTETPDPMSSLTNRARAIAVAAHEAMPGVLVALTVAMAAMFLGARYGAPVMLFALLIGMSFHFLSVEGRCASAWPCLARESPPTRSSALVPHR